MIATIPQIPLIHGVTWPIPLTKEGTAPVVVLVLVGVVLGTDFVGVGVVNVLFPAAGVLEGTLVLVDVVDTDAGTVIKGG